MNTEYTVPNNCSYRQIIESIANISPNFYVEFSFTFIVETIYFIYLCALMVSPKEEEIIGMLDFISHEQTKTLQRSFAPIDIVTKEQIILV